MSAAIAGAEPRDPIAAGTAIGLFAVATLVLQLGFASFLRVIEGRSDLTSTSPTRGNLRSLADLKSPHFLFQLLVWAGSMRSV